MSKQSRESLEEQYRLEEAREKRNSTLKRLGIWSAVVVGLFVMVLALAKLGATPQTTNGGTLSDNVTATDWTKGTALSKTTLVEYADFECPACAAFYPLMKDLQQKYGTQVQFVFRHYPLAQHRNADLAARAAEAAGKQNKFWEMHDKLFETQATWSRKSNARPDFVDYARALGLNVDQFTADLDSTEIKNKIQDQVTGANKSSVRATPTFFLNGQQLVINTYDDLERAILDSLQQK